MAKQSTASGHATRLTSLVVIGFATLAIAGCGGGGSGSGGSATPQTTPPTTSGSGGGEAPAPTNRPPTISGTPVTTAQAGQPYSFAPTASDPDGQALRFSISGKPGWANFDPATGALTGTPRDADAGSSSSVSISVTDGTATATLAPFTLTVMAPTTGWATLRWAPPTQNVDGTPLTNLAGYRIRYGTAANTLTSSVDIPGSSVTTATIEGLTAGTWYFAVKAYTTGNVESDLSNVASKTIG